MGLTSAAIAVTFKVLAKVLEADKQAAVHTSQRRHGGASHDYVPQSRVLKAARRRGRWRLWDSARRYDKGSRTDVVAARLSPSQRQYADECIVSLAKARCGKRLACRPPWVSESPWKSSPARAASRKLLRSKALE